MTDKSPDHLKYYSQLDGLRCFAVVSVMIGHWIGWDARTHLVRNIPWGHGVMLFFVLSGYLISNILFGLKEQMSDHKITLNQALKTFYIRRFLRIFPAYYLLLFYLFYIDHKNTRDIFPWLLTYTSNLLECRDGTFLGDFNHFWSLAVEEQFYILWPMIILLVNRKYIFRVILSFMIVSVMSRFACFFFAPNWMMTSYFTPNLFFPLCLGALLAYSKRYHPALDRFFRSYKWLAGSVIFYVGFYYFHKMLYKVDFMKAALDEYVFSIACAFIIFRASHNGFKFLANFILTHDVVVYIGKISYGLYLYHLFIIGLFWNYLYPRFELHVNNKHMAWFLYFVAAFCIAVFSYYAVEKPANSLKRHFKY